jgi:hypothetical protein
MEKRGSSMLNIFNSQGSLFSRQNASYAASSGCLRTVAMASSKHSIAELCVRGLKVPKMLHSSSNIVGFQALGYDDGSSRTFRRNVLLPSPLEK